MSVFDSVRAVVFQYWFCKDKYFSIGSVRTEVFQYW